MGGPQAGYVWLQPGDVGLQAAHGRVGIVDVLHVELGRQHAWNGQKSVIIGDLGQAQERRCSLPSAS